MPHRKQALPSTCCPDKQNRDVDKGCSSKKHPFKTKDSFSKNRTGKNGCRKNRKKGENDITFSFFRIFVPLK